MKNGKWIVAIVISCIANISSAYVITLDPSQFDSGTNISEAFNGASLYSATMNQPDLNQPSVLGLTSSIYAIDCIGCKPQVDGTRVFGQSVLGYQPTPIFDYENSFRFQLQSHHHYSDGWVFMAAFDNPTNFVQIIGSGATTYTPFRMDYWGVTGDWLGSYTDIVNGTCNSVRLETPPNPWPTGNTDQSITSCYTNSPEIAFITAGGSDGPGYISQLSYNYISVPQPAPITLVGAGVLAFFILRRNGRITR